MLLTCRQISRALCDKDYAKLSSYNRFMLKMHVFMCGMCGQYNRQVMSLQDGLRLYLGAIVLLALIAYLAADYLILKRNSRGMTASGYIRFVLLTGILVSGGLLVIRNLTGTHFSPEFIIFLDITHLGLVVALLVVGLYCQIRKKHWTTAR